MMIRFKHFYNSLNIVLILAPDRETFCGKCTQFPLCTMHMFSVTLYHFTCL